MSIAVRFAADMHYQTEMASVYGKAYLRRAAAFETLGNFMQVIAGLQCRFTVV